MNQIKQGINCTILANGQTGSGKTYTMFGGKWAMNDKSNDYEQRKNFNKDKYNFILNEELMIDPFSKTNEIKTKSKKRNLIYYQIKQIKTIRNR